MPSPVDKYVKQVREQNPDYSESQVWATAWSIYCKHKNPGSDHCKKPTSEYLKGKKAMSEFDEFKDAVVVANVVARVVEGGMVAKDPKGVGDWLLENVLKVGQKVQVWTGRGKQDYHEGVIADVKLWPKPGDKAFIRDNLTGRVTRKDEYTIKFEREPAYPGEPREAVLKVEGIRSGEGAHVSFGKGRERVYKLSVG